MKKIVLIVLLLITVLVQSSCSLLDNTIVDSEEKIDSTFRKLYWGINSEDYSKIEPLFAENVRSSSETFTEDIKELVSFFDGSLLNYTSSKNGGLFIETNMDYGKRIRNVECCFSIITSRKTYHIFIIECTEDDYDSKNIGIKSLYVIEAENWQEECLYRGDRKLTKCINIIREKID